MRARLAFSVLVLTTWAATGVAATRLALPGWPLSTREGQALFRSALRSPADSSALVSALAAATARMQSAGYLDARLRADWSSVFMASFWHGQGSPG